jgi:predicted RNA binding protein YcfA (HicA-like mRNA interferase family)
MPRLPALSAKEVIKALSGFGFYPVRQTGSHVHLWNPQKRILVTVPNHPELARGTLLAIIKQAKLGKSEFLRAF